MCPQMDFVHRALPLDGSSEARSTLKIVQGSTDLELPILPCLTRPNRWRHSLYP